jgi:hypothetical protein
MMASVAEEEEDTCPPRGIPFRKSHSSRREEADAECCEVLQRWKSLQQSAIDDAPDLFLIYRFPIAPKVFLIGGRPPCEEDDEEAAVGGHEEDPIVHVDDSEVVVEAEGPPKKELPPLAASTDRTAFVRVTLSVNRTNAKINIPLLCKGDILALLLLLLLLLRRCPLMVLLLFRNDDKPKDTILLFCISLLFEFVILRLFCFLCVCVCVLVAGADASSVIASVIFASDIVVVVVVPVPVA